MAKLTQSYVHGASTLPLIGDTIAAHFDSAAGCWADRPALIVRQQKVRWTYRELKARADALAADALRLKDQINEVAQGLASPGVDRAVRGLQPHRAAPRARIVPGTGK